MDLQLAGALMVGILFLLLFLGMPIAYSLASAGVAGLMMTRGWGTVEFLLGTFTYSYTANFGLIVLPLFLFTGYMAFVSGVSNRAFEAAEKAIGHVAGGLAIATSFACAAFAMICHSSVAAASTMGRVALPEMLNRGYAKPLAAGCVAAGGTLGVLMPPSGMLVIYSIAAQVSMVDLFVAALIPAFLTAALYPAFIYGAVKMYPSLVRDRRVTRYPLRERIRAVGGAWEVIVLFAVVMGSIYLGIATPTEAAAVGALLAFLIAAVRSKGDRWSLLREGLRQTGTSTASIFLLVIGAGLFSLALSTTQIPAMVGDWLLQHGGSRYFILTIILLAYFILGCFIDGISMVLLATPIAFPIIVKLGFDPIWFGIIVTKTVEIGALTPPVGINAFVVKEASNELTLSDVFKGCAPFVVLEILIVVILVIFPQIAYYGK